MVGIECLAGGDQTPLELCQPVLKHGTFLTERMDFRHQSNHGVVDIPGVLSVSCP